MVFAQYVNNYYIQGTAEIVSINVDKEYRSNFICEHTSLKNTIHRMINKWGKNSVKFYFADDTIISGSTITRANDLLRTLIPKEFKNAFPINIIDKCFVLIDRLSNNSKRNYVRDIENDFISFVHIDISSMRTQGDSCVGCKLQQDAKKLFKRSSTKELANYWAIKNYSLRSIDFDNSVELKEYKENLSYERLVFSHIAQNVIFKDNDSFNESTIFNSILSILLCVLGVKIKNNSRRKQISFDEIGNEELIKTQKSIMKKFGKLFIFEDKEKKLLFLEAFLKVVSRPFFTFDFKVRSQVLRLFLILTETFMGNENVILEDKDILIGINKKIYKLLGSRYSKVEFLQDYLIEPLADMKSTFLLRKETIFNISKYIDSNEKTLCSRDNCRKRIDGADCNKKIIECFWREYVAHVHRTIDCSSDEAKSLWFEYLLISGSEYHVFTHKNEGLNNFGPTPLYESLDGNSLNNNSEFMHFCNEVFLLNTRIIFDGIEKVLSLGNSSSDDYFMRHWNEFLEIDNFIVPKEKFQIKALKQNNPQCNLFKHLKQDERNSEDNKGSLDINKRYNELFVKIIEMLNEKYNIVDISISLITYSKKQDEQSSDYFQDIQGYDIIASKCSESYSQWESYEIKNKILEALNANKGEKIPLLKYGYILDYNDNPNIVLFFDNPTFHFNLNSYISFDRELKKIAPVFVFIGFNAEERKEDLIYFMIIRDILSYRNRLLRFLENDFAGDIYSKYAHSTGEKNILVHEKVASHLTNTDDESDFEILRSKTNNQYVFDEKLWLLFRSYTNRQIAKLFSRSFSSVHDYDRNADSIPPLYPNEDKVGFLGKQITNVSDLFYFKSEKDFRLDLLNHIIRFEVDNVKELLKTELIHNGDNYYNLEYVKCILVDILLSAVKYASDEIGFLNRINAIYTEKKDWGNKEKDKRCVIRIYRTKEYFVDFLVIENPINDVVNEISDINYNNDIITRRFRDPIDYATGHMSLFTIKKYIEGLGVKSLEPKFENMIMSKGDRALFSSDDKRFKYVIKFQSRLPILKGNGDKK